MNITDTLSQIVALTQQNISILKALNDSFYTKKEHISVSVNGDSYAIPSFLSLENKVEMLQQDLENILNAPKTGEAFTYFDGTTQKLELSGYSTTPTHVELSTVDQFNVGRNDIFKDFMNPNPYVKLDISSIPNNIKHVNVKKISIKNEELIGLINNLISSDGESSSYQIEYSELYKLLYNYEEGVDYIDYNTTKRLPIRMGGAYGYYTILNIIDNYTDSNFDEHYELELNKDLTYTINNGTITRNINVGDYLVTNNDKVQLLVEEIHPTNRSIKVRVMYGAYADLCDSTSNNTDLCNIKFYKPANYDNTKYIEVPLEEDKYVVVFIAPINDTTNTQAPWGRGLYFDTDNLIFITPDGVSTNFREYYDKYVNNVGDSLFAITHMMDDDAQIEKLTSSQFAELKEYTPVIEEENIHVTQINKHLNDSKSIQTIRNLYNQKSQYKNELAEVQSAIDNINATLSEISFDDTNNTRTLYETQLVEYNSKKKELTANINSIVNEITENANSSDVPIENAKYHIRGFVNVNDFESTHPFAKVIKIDVEYRYKNKNKFTGNAETLGESFIYSDWNKMSSIYRKYIPNYEGNAYTYSWEDINDTVNSISFNQLDIPITQGETVDIRVRYIYNLGYPFAEFVSDWSPIFNQSFPDEYLTNVEVLDIISENNDDIKKNQYIGLMDQYGLIEHSNDTIQDQTIKYFHQPEHIASGFYTEERRIIPLKTKLEDIVGNIRDLNSEVYGAITENLTVVLSDNTSAIQLKPNMVNQFNVLAYDQNPTKVEIDDESSLLPSWVKTDVLGGKDMYYKYSQLSLCFINNGEYPLKFHTMFPGDYTQQIDQFTQSKFDVEDYIIADDETFTGGVYMMLDETINGDKVIPQRYNQFLYFRTNVDGGLLYDIDALDIIGNDDLNDASEGNNKMAKNKLLGTKDIALEYRTSQFTPSEKPEEIKDLRSAYLLPYPGTLSKICIDTNDKYLQLNPGDSIVIPLSFYYWFDMENASDDARKITRSIAFDVRNSLFADPVTYKLNVTANSTDTSARQTVTSTDLTDLPSYNLTAVEAYTPAKKIMKMYDTNKQPMAIKTIKKNRFK